jgi:hypothetical protein
VRQLRLPACVGLSWACAKQGGRHTADRLLARNKQRVSLQVFDLLLTVGRCSQGRACCGARWPSLPCCPPPRSSSWPAGQQTRLQWHRLRTGCEFEHRCRSLAAVWVGAHAMLTDELPQARSLSRHVRSRGTSKSKWTGQIQIQMSQIPAAGKSNQIKWSPRGKNNNKYKSNQIPAPKTQMGPNVAVRGEPRHSVVLTALPGTSKNLHVAQIDPSSTRPMTPGLSEVALCLRV